MFSLSTTRAKRALITAISLAVPLAITAGCGGGGGSNGSPSKTATPVPPQSGVLFSDDFNSSSFDTGKWGRYTNPQQLQRTRFGSLPTNRSEDGTSFTRLTLDSYNPDAPGQFFRGTEIYTFRSFTVGNGLEAEVRLRAPNLPPGLVLAFFLINDRYVGTPSDQTYRKDEIDYEFLTAQQEQFAGNTRNRLYTNVWNDWNQPRDGFDGNDIDDGTNRLHDDKVYQPSVDPNYDFADWNVYKIRWYSDRTEFYVNDRLERIEREVVPAEQALSLHFNFWSPTGDFSQAFSGNLPGPVASSSNPDRKIYQFDVDYVRVTALGSGANSARVATGDEAAQPLPANLKSYRNR